MKKRIFIHEVVPRDGLQIEPTFLPTEEKIALINALSETGVAKIEATAFVSPKAVPNLRDAQEVMQGIQRHQKVVYTVLVPNVKGAERALESKPDEINLVMSASETHNLANMRMTLEKSLENFASVMEMVKDEQVKVNGTIATTFGCPFEGEVPVDKILNIVEDYLSLGFDYITLADTTGMATPVQVQSVVESIYERFPKIDLTLHFHNTRGMGLVNVMAGIEVGVTKFDAALGGIGGCPFAPGATGNICTEDLVHMLEFSGFDTGVDLDRLIQLSKKLEKLLGHPVPGQVMKAGKITDLHPIPESVLQLQK